MLTMRNEEGPNAGTGGGIGGYQEQDGNRDSGVTSVAVGVLGGGRCIAAVSLNNLILIVFFFSFFW